MTKKITNSDPPAKKKQHRKKKKKNEKILVITEIANPIHISVSEAAKLGGINSRTIRRAIQDEKITYKIVKDRYQLDFKSTLHFLYSNRKLRNKLLQNGIGQYIESWQR
ncbi:MAG: hypothetical protein U9M94_01780 [Patescibacteria group bacterium]|nr:hypothetical protein [Patescibacteria group bacterium]